MSNNIQLQLDVKIKGIDLSIKGEVHPPQNGIKELSLLGELSHLSENLEVLLQDVDEENSFYEAIQPFVPQSLNFGVYKLSKEKKNASDENIKLTLFQLSAGYKHFKLKGVFSKELKLFSAGINHPISFGDLPVVGEYLKENNISNLEFVFIPKQVQKSGNKEEIPASETLTKQNDVTNELVKFAKERFVDVKIWKEKDALVLAEGFNGGLVFNSGTRTQKYRYPYEKKQKEEEKKEAVKKKEQEKVEDTISENEEKEKTDAASTLNTTAAEKKKFPVSITNIKPSLVKNKVSIAVDANFTIGPFGLQLIGLGLSFPVSEILHPTQFDFGKVEYHLDQLALSYETPTLKIGGVFLRDTSGQNVIYNGLLQIKLIKTEIIAIGSYTKIGDTSSLFAFGYLGVNIPLHPAINILGLGIGFGLNRSFVMPPIAKVRSFPIVKVINGEQEFEGEALKTFFQDLNTYIKPEDGCYILMGAVKFESFKVIQTTAIIAVTFGNKLNINLLGVSKFEKKGSYNIELGFSVLVDIDEGIFMAKGEFSNNSYILTPKIKITGGFAYGMWFKNEKAGDFVVSLGGYHPKFQVPKHYPQSIPRICVDFNVEDVHFIAKVYFAITPTCMMAGLDASLTTKYVSSLLSVDIFVKLVADFRINFQPFNYETQANSQIHLYLTVGKGWFSISYNFDLVAQLNIYGPDLGGDGYLSISKFNIPLKFGEPKKRLTFSKDQFIKHYFPKEDEAKILTYNISNGFINKFTRNNQEVIIVNPKDFELEITSKIPITNINNHNDLKRNKIHLVCDNFPQLVNKLNIGTNIDNDNFIIEPILQSQPKALWTDGPSRPNQLSSQLLDNVCMGIRLKFKQDNPKPIFVTVSLYEKLVKKYEYEIDNLEIKQSKLNNIELLSTCKMKSFGILTDNEIDYTDLENSMDVYKYKPQSLGTYQIA
ncbi:hypothetical protein B4N84_07655 [Flavobacterium sp. IR1]|nr:hypothetical protein B4N84_07655 [Flavobacterium sp. IR1]